MTVGAVGFLILMRSSGRVTDRRKTVRGKRRKERVKKTREGKGTEKGSGGVRVKEGWRE